MSGVNFYSIKSGSLSRFAACPYFFYNLKNFLLSLTGAEFHLRLWKECQRQRPAASGTGRLSRSPGMVNLNTDTGAVFVDSFC